MSEYKDEKYNRMKKTADQSVDSCGMADRLKSQLEKMKKEDPVKSELEDLRAVNKFLMEKMKANGRSHFCKQTCYSCGKDAFFFPVYHEKEGGLVCLECALRMKCGHGNCSICGEADLIVKTGSCSGKDGKKRCRVSFVLCNSCGASSPRFTSHEKIIIPVWNSIGRAMIKTKEDNDV